MPIAIEAGPAEAEHTGGRNVLHTGNILAEQAKGVGLFLGTPVSEGSATPTSQVLSIFKQCANCSPSASNPLPAKALPREALEYSANLVIDARGSDLNAMAVSAIAYAMSILAIPLFANLTIELCPPDARLWGEPDGLLQSVCSSLQPFASAGLHLAGLCEEQVLQLRPDSRPPGITGLHLSGLEPPPSQALRALCDEWGWQLYCGGFPHDVISPDIFDQINCSWMLRYTAFDRCHSILQQTGYFFGSRH